MPPHRRTASKQFVTDGRLLGEIDQLRQTLKRALQVEKYNSQGLADEAPRLERQLLELAELAAEGAVTVTVEGLPGEEWDEIVRRHPPSSEQLDRYRIQAKTLGWAEMPEWNADTMAPDLLAACLVEPVWSESWWRELSKGTQNQIMSLALGVQLQGADLPFFNAATATTNGGGEPSTLPVNGVSPTADS